MSVKPLIFLTVSASVFCGCKKDEPTRSEAELANEAAQFAEKRRASGEPHAVPDPVEDKIHIHLSDDGFDPSDARAKPGQTMVLVFKRSAETACGDMLTVDQVEQPVELPLGKAIEVSVTMPTSGPLRFHCRSMQGRITPDA